MIAGMLGSRYPWARPPCAPAQVTVADQGSGEAGVPLAVAGRERDAYVARINRLFGAGAGAASSASVPTPS